MVVKLAEGTLKTKYGEFREMLFYDGQKETIAFIMGEVVGAEILKEIGVKSIVMLTDNPNKVETLTQFGIEVVGTKSTSL